MIPRGSVELLKYYWRNSIMVKVKDEGQYLSKSTIEQAALVTDSQCKKQSFLP
jgi:hypothetical protein